MEIWETGSKNSAVDSCDSQCTHWKTKFSFLEIQITGFFQNLILKDKISAQTS